MCVLRCRIIVFLCVIVLYHNCRIIVLLCVWQHILGIEELNEPLEVLLKVEAFQPVLGITNFLSDNKNGRSQNDFELKL